MSATRPGPATSKLPRTSQLPDSGFDLGGGEGLRIRFREPPLNLLLGDARFEVVLGRLGGAEKPEPPAVAGADLDWRIGLVQFGGQLLVGDQDGHGLLTIGHRFHQTTPVRSPPSPAGTTTA